MKDAMVILTFDLLDQIIAAAGLLFHISMYRNVKCAIIQAE